MKKRIEAGEIEQGATVVGILTGNGLKDPETAIEVNKEKPMMTKAEFEDFLRQLKEGEM